MTADVPLSELMAQAPASRAAMWQLCAQIADRPTTEFVEALRDGTVVRRIEASTAWLGDTYDVETITGALQAFRECSSRYTPAQDLGELTQEWQRTESADIVTLCRTQQEEARAEAEAWGDYDAASAKAMRSAQFEAFVPQLGKLMDWCHRSHDESQLLIWKALIRVVVSHAGIEAARDLLTDFDDPTRRLSLEF